MAKFTVDRRTWGRGEGSHTAISRLLRPDGKRCCIGFVGQQCGVSDAEMMNVGAIHHICLKNDIVRFPAWMQAPPGASGPKGTDDIYTAYSTNDDDRLDDENREALLKELFLKHGDEIEFIN